ncbi:MAG: bifunctional 4-hydroxy-2-oxoglutarate aldolase/2-dehydro-3-deoxy-phosphogluconate aldolase [Clostridia bacterium]|nr:bifunctional 4-hydroxy-2-oxoglutarate aldolase/2-dehydro-3-deoxy-phosphogluconate aldolase [Clostridia bacterium]
MRNNIINTIEKEKIITIVRGVEKEDLIPFAEAVYAGGIRLIEITYSANGDTSDEETAKNIETLAKHFGDRMLIGAGTVLSEKQVALTKNAGGCFIISPDTYENVIAKTRELEMVSIPGALTPSEVQSAHRFGADFVKLFPVTSLGTEYVKAIKAPLSHIKMLAVGGVNEKNMKDYLDAGVSGFGIGSNIVNKKLIRSGDFDAICALAEKYTAVIK